MDFTELDFDSAHGPIGPLTYPHAGVYEWHFGDKTGTITVDEPGEYIFTLTPDGQLKALRVPSA